MLVLGLDLGDIFCIGLLVMVVKFCLWMMIFVRFFLGLLIGGGFDGCDGDGGWEFCFGFGSCWLEEGWYVFVFCCCGEVVGGWCGLIMLVIEGEWFVNW